jgi:hypothetical protein
MSTLAGHPADYDREVVQDLSDDELARRREQVLQARERADAELRVQLPPILGQARQLLSAGSIRELRLLLLDLAGLAHGSSAVLLHDCCVALAEEIERAESRLADSVFGGLRNTEPLNAPFHLMLEECSSLLADQAPPAPELIEYLQAFWQDLPASWQRAGDA